MYASVRNPYQVDWKPIWGQEIVFNQEDNSQKLDKQITGEVVYNDSWAYSKRD